MESMQSRVRGAEAQLQRMRGALEAMDAERRDAMDVARQHRAGAEQRLQRSLQEQRTLVLALSAKSQELEELQRAMAAADEGHAAALASAQAAVEDARSEAQRAKDECRRAMERLQCTCEPACSDSQGLDLAPGALQCTCGAAFPAPSDPGKAEGRSQPGPEAEGSAGTEEAEHKVDSGEVTVKPRLGGALEAPDSKGACAACHSAGRGAAPGPGPPSREAFVGAGQGQESAQRSLDPGTQMWEGELERVRAERDAFREALEYAHHEHRLVALSLKAANQSQAIRQLLGELAASRAFELRLRATLGRVTQQLHSQEAANEGCQGPGARQVHVPGEGEPCSPGTTRERGEPRSPGTTWECGEQAEMGDEALRDLETVLIDEPQDLTPMLESEPA